MCKSLLLLLLKEFLWRSTPRLQNKNKAISAKHLRKIWSYLVKIKNSRNFMRNATAKLFQLFSSRGLINFIFYFLNFLIMFYSSQVYFQLQNWLQTSFSESTWCIICPLKNFLSLKKTFFNQLWLCLHKPLNYMFYFIVDFSQSLIIFGFMLSHFH